MIYRLRYCNKDGVEARVDIQKGSATPIVEVEGTERPFILSYNNDKGDKSGMFLSSSADIEIYETSEFNINNLKTSNETELSVTHYINNVISWQGFIIPDFFSIEVRSNPVITMTASDRLGTLKNVTLSDLPSMISLRELAILCLNKTGLTLPLRTMADFNNGTGINDFFNSKILTQRLSDTRGRSISCYDILSSILTASNSFLVQRSGSWHIINKIQHEAGSGKLYTGATSFINWSDVISNFSDISTGGRRTIVPVASTVGVFHEFGGSKTYPSNYEFKDGASGWTVNFPDEMEARFDNRNILGFDVLVSGGGYQPVYGTETNNPHMVIYGFRGPLNYVKSEDIVVPTGYGTDVEIKFDINASAPIWNFGSFQRMAVFAVKGTATKALVSGSFVPLNEVTESQYMNRINFEQGPVYVGELARVATESFGVSGKLSDAEGLDGYTIHIRLYSSDRAYATVINFATINFAPVGEMAKGNLYKTERTDNYTKDHDIDTSLFADYLTTGLNGYFYRYAIDDTSSLYNSANELTSKWTAYNDTEQLPLLQHITRQRSRLFSVAHDLLSAEMEVNNFDPLAIFVACEKRHTVVSAQFDFFKSNLSVELEEIDFQSASARDFIYSYFGDGESGIKSIGGISGGGGSGGTGGGLTPEQIEILSWWKKDPDNPNTIFTEMNAYSKMELSAYGVGSGGGGGGSNYERLDTWADYDSSKAGWVLSAFLGNDLNARVTNLENSAGSGSVTSVGISVPTGLSVSNSPITSSGVIAIGLQAGYSIPTTVKQGEWDTAFTNNHTHSNKTQLDLITQSNIDVLAKLSIVNGNLQINGNAYATGELSAYGAGTGGGGGGGIIETVYGYGNLGQTFNNSILTDTFNAYTINQINTRLIAVESGSATTVNTTGTGNAVTSISKAGSVITANKNLTFLETSIFNTHNNDNIRHITVAERTKWDGVVTDFGNLEIGGRNLWTNSRTIPATVTIGQFGYSSGFKNISELGLKTGELITFSVYVSNIPVGERVYARIDFFRPDGTYTYVANTQYSISNEGVAYISTFMQDTSEFDRVRYRVMPVNYTANYQVNVVHEKLERGTKATDWTPAPEDQVSDWLTTDVNSFSFIKNKPTTLAGYGITDAYTKTEVNSALISKLDKSVFDDLFEKVEVSPGVFAIKAKYNFYGVGEVSAYGIGSGGGSGGGGIIETVYGYGNLGQTFNNANLTDTFNAYTINQINTRLIAVESGSALTVNTTGTGNAITSISKAGSVITANKDLSFLETSIFNTHNTDNARHITGAERTKWDGVVTDFNNLEIGGRNLLPLNNLKGYRGGSLVDQTSYSVSDNGIISVINNPSSTLPGWNLNVSDGTLFTISGETTSSISTMHFYYRSYDIAGNITQAQASFTFPVVNNKFKHTRNFIIPVDTAYLHIGVGSDAMGISYDMRIKLEKGNKPTDWTPAPEDQVSDWLTTDVNSFSFIKNKPTTLAGYGITDAVTLNTAQTITGAKTFSGTVTASTFSGALAGNATTATTATNLSRSIIAGNGLTGGGALNADRTITLGTPGTLSNSTTNSVTTTSHTHSVDPSDFSVSSLRNTMLNITTPATALSINYGGLSSANAGNLPVSDNANAILTMSKHTGNYDSQLAFSGNGNIYYRAFSNESLNTTKVWNKLAFTTDNVASASKLQTPRTIWGQSFDGTGNVTGALSGATTIAASTSVTAPKVIFNSAGWSMEQVGSELQMKHNNVLKMRFTSTGAIVATNEITAFG